VRYIAGHSHRLPTIKGKYRQRGKKGQNEHVAIAELALGHSLPNGAQVHHVDGNSHNNAPQNLVICQDRAYHFLLHVRTRLLKAGADPNTERVCCDCLKVKPFADFNKAKSSKNDGLQSHCRECSKIRWQDYMRRKENTAC
jgi:hypothetical protein